MALPLSAQVSLLPAEKAFRFSARAIDARSVEARFTIADGYYLYRDKIYFRVEPTSTRLSVPELPSGKIKEDEFFGRVETYRGSVVITLGLQGITPGQKLVLKAESQGCADLGICYPPTVQQVTLALPDASSAGPSTPANIGKKAWFN